MMINPGTKLGRYEIRSKIVEGGQAYHFGGYFDLTYGYR
jgi:hypothetical protein